MLKRKKAVLNLSLEIAFVKVLHVLNSFSITYPRTFLESRRALQPHKPCKYEVPETLGLKLLIQEAARLWGHGHCSAQCWALGLGTAASGSAEQCPVRRRCWPL